MLQRSRTTRRLNAETPPGFRLTIVDRSRLLWRFRRLRCHVMERWEGLR